MSEILFLAHRIPFPPDRGDKIRSNHLLNALAALAPVHVGCLADGEADLAHEGELAAIAASHCVVPRARSMAAAGVEALVRRLPVSVAAFDCARLRAWVRDVLRQRAVSTIFVYSGQMAQYVPASFSGRVVMDFVDVDSAKFEAYADESSGLRRWLYAREARLLRGFEEAVARRAALSLFVTPEEVALFRSRVSRTEGIAVEALGNGIDAEAWKPDGIAPAAELAQGGPNLVFTGQMDYPPNIAAVTMFAREVMPRVRALHGDARFAIVGRAPAASVRALGGMNGTVVTGAVADVRPWLAGADLVVAPLTIARGVQNKVLEAMAMARPVLLTPAAATGIPAQDGTHFAVADGGHALGTRTLALLADPTEAQAMGAAARQFVIENAAWSRILARLPQIVRGATDAA